jgi:hypothetical protein
VKLGNPRKWERWGDGQIGQATGDELSGKNIIFFWGGEVSRHSHQRRQYRIKGKGKPGNERQKMAGGKG